MPDHDDDLRTLEKTIASLEEEFVATAPRVRRSFARVQAKHPAPVMDPHDAPTQPLRTIEVAELE